nr:MAG TPA: hypothetical protein [Caudoviricetes sp.]
MSVRVADRQESKMKAQRAALDAYYTELFNEEAPTCKKRRKRKR